MKSIDPVAVARMILILFHLLAFAVAAAATAMADYAIFARSRVHIRLLRNAAKIVTLTLVVLWATGLCIIWIDTQFNIAVIGSAPKLLAKLTVVSLLTLNGIALHRLAFPKFERDQADPYRAAFLPAVLGAVSTTTWLFAAFLGVARAVTPLLGYVGFIVLYVIVLSCAISIALLMVQPRLAKMMSRRKRERIGESALLVTERVSA